MKKLTIENAKLYAKAKCKYCEGTGQVLADYSEDMEVCDCTHENYESALADEVDDQYHDQ